jgi:hypothetical protein
MDPAKELNYLDVGVAHTKILLEDPKNCLLIFTDPHIECRAAAVADPAGGGAVDPQAHARFVGRGDYFTSAVRPSAVNRLAVLHRRLFRVPDCFSSVKGALQAAKRCLRPPMRGSGLLTY